MDEWMDGWMGTDRQRQTDMFGMNRWMDGWMDQ